MTKTKLVEMLLQHGRLMKLIDDLEAAATANLDLAGPLVVIVGDTLEALMVKSVIFGPKDIEVLEDMEYIVQHPEVLRAALQAAVTGDARIAGLIIHRVEDSPKN